MVEHQDLRLLVQTPGFLLLYDVVEAAVADINIPAIGAKAKAVRPKELIESIITSLNLSLL